MLSEVKLVKRYLGARFGYGEALPAGTYAVPCRTSKGLAFMKAEVRSDGNLGGFDLFWDEELKHDWHTQPRPSGLGESQFARSFRDLEEARLELT